MRWLRRRGAERLNQHEQKILDNIRDHGWFCWGVFDPDGNGPDFSYSVGFTTALGAPEFIIFGLDLKLMRSMLWGVFDQIRDGREVRAGDRWSGLLDGFDCIAHPVHPTNLDPEYLNSALWYWGRNNPKGALPAFQLFWPGSVDGLFPWDPGCADDVRALQPALHLLSNG